MKKLNIKNKNLISKTAETRYFLHTRTHTHVFLKDKKTQNNNTSKASSSYVDENIIKNRFEKSPNNIKRRREIPTWNIPSIWRSKGDGVHSIKINKQNKMIQISKQNRRTPSPDGEILHLSGGCRGKPKKLSHPLQKTV